MAIDKEYIRYISEKSILAHMELADGFSYVQEVVSNTLSIRCKLLIYLTYACWIDTVHQALQEHLLNTSHHIVHLIFVTIYLNQRIEIVIHIRLHRRLIKRTHHLTQLLYLKEKVLAKLLVEVLL